MTPRRYDIRKTRIIALELHRSFCYLAYPFKVIPSNHKNGTQPAESIYSKDREAEKRLYEFAPGIDFASVSDTIAYFAPG